MIIRYEPESCRVTLAQPSDFSRFSVDAAGCDAATLEAALRRGDAGRLSGAGAIIRASFLSEAAGSLRGDPAWQSSLAEMITDAASRGWLTSDRQFIHAHIENLAVS